MASSVEITGTVDGNAASVVAATREARRIGWFEVALVLTLLDASIWIAGAQLGIAWPGLGGDLGLHRDAATRWLTDGSPYLPVQLTGPYDVWALQPMPFLYPPSMLPLFVAFLYLPGVLWYVIPLGVTIVAIAVHRPTRTQIIVMLLLLAWPQTISSLISGNVLMWVLAALAVGTHVPAISPLVFLKPSLFPFGFWNAQRGSWWAGLAVVILAAIPFGHLWAEWATALFDSRQSLGLLYSIYQVPALLIPLVPVLRDPRRQLMVRASG